MDDSQYITLAKEIQDIQYSGLTEQQIVDSIMAKDKSEPITYVDGTDILKQVDTSDFGKLSPEDRNILLSLVSKNIPVDSGFFRDLLFAMFTENSITRNNLNTLFTKTTSKSIQLNLGIIKDYHIKVAKELIKLTPEGQLKETDTSLVESAHNAVYDVMKSDFALDAITELEVK